MTAKLLAGRASYTRTLLNTAHPQIEQLIRQSLQLQIANALDDAALEGSGSGANPTGIANVSGIETFSTASGSTMTHAESLNALAEIAANNVDTSNVKWIVHPTNAATLGAQVVDSDSGRFVYDNGQILGRQVIESTHVTAGTIIAGDFSKCFIGMFGGLDLVIDPYTNGSTGVVNVYAYQLCDVAVVQPEHFTKITLTA